MFFYILYSFSGILIQSNDTTEIYTEYEYEISVQLSPLRANPVYLKYYTFLTR